MPSLIDLLDTIDTEVASTNFDANRFLDYLDLASAVSTYHRPNTSEEMFRRFDNEDRRVPYKPRPLMDYDPYDPSVEFGPRTAARIGVRPGRRPGPRIFPLDTPPLNSPLLEISDRRKWTPNPIATRLSIVGHAYKNPRTRGNYVKYKVGNYTGKVSERLWFVDRTGAIPCIRRRIRRSVLFAKNFGGVHKLKRPHWKNESYTFC